ncbi:MAG: acyl carrier protein [Verrucomicrobiota bacterium]
MSDPVVDAINTVRENLDLPAISDLDDAAQLRRDLGMDSLALAELGVRLEDATGIDVFSNRVVETVGDIRVELKLGEAS